MSRPCNYDCVSSLFVLPVSVLQVLFEIKGKNSKFWFDTAMVDNIHTVLGPSQCE